MPEIWKGQMTFGLPAAIGRTKNACQISVLNKDQETDKTKSKLNK